MFECDWCKTIKKRMAIFYNPHKDLILCLCFHGCQHFPEPFQKLDPEYSHWSRMDPWQNVKRLQSRLRKHMGIIGAPKRQTTLEAES